MAGKKESEGNIPLKVQIIRDNWGGSLETLLKMVQVYYPDYTMAKLKGLVIFEENNRRKKAAKEQKFAAQKKEKPQKKQTERSAPKKPAASVPQPDLAERLVEVKKRITDGFREFGELVNGVLDSIEQIMIEVERQKPLADAARRFNLQ